MSDKTAVIMAKVDDQFYLLSDKKGEITGRDTVEALNKELVLKLLASHGGVINQASVTIMQIMLAPKVLETSYDVLNDGLISDQGTNVALLRNNALNTYGVLLNGDKKRIEQLYDGGKEINREIANAIDL